MTILEFIFAIFVTLCVVVVMLGTVTTIWDNTKLQEENQKLKDKKYRGGKK